MAACSWRSVRFLTLFSALCARVRAMFLTTLLLLQGRCAFYASVVAVASCLDAFPLLLSWAAFCCLLHKKEEEARSKKGERLAVSGELDVNW